MNNIVYFDLEVSNNGKIMDIGAINQNGDTFHSSVISDFLKFISSAEYLCGHNIVSHDIKYLKPYLKKSYTLIDTLYMSPILFPEKPYHNRLSYLYAGQEININDIYAEVALRNKISQLTDKGYHAQRASIRHIVYWRPQNIEGGATNSIEIPIVLPEIIFRKR